MPNLADAIWYEFDYQRMTKVSYGLSRERFKAKLLRLWSPLHERIHALVTGNNV